MPLALAVIDIDRFKSVNDDHGHDVGDVILKGVAARIREAVEGKGRAYRYGGEEIVAILPNMTLEEALPVAERIRSSVETTRFESLLRAITVSIGLAAFPQHGGDPQALFRAADQALFSALWRLCYAAIRTSTLTLCIPRNAPSPSHMSSCFFPGCVRLPLGCGLHPHFL